jgi:hypothetical protein
MIMTTILLLILIPRLLQNDSCRKSIFAAEMSPLALDQCSDARVMSGVEQRDSTDSLDRQQRLLAIPMEAGDMGCGRCGKCC